MSESSKVKKDEPRQLNIGELESIIIDFNKQYVNLDKKYYDIKQHDYRENEKVQKMMLKLHYRFESYKTRIQKLRKHIKSANSREEDTDTYKIAITNANKQVVRINQTLPRIENLIKKITKEL